MRRRTRIKLVRRLAFDREPMRPSRMSVVEEVSPEIEGTIESGDAGLEGSSSPAEQHDMPTHSRNSNCLEDDGLSPEEAAITDYSLTDEESDGALEISPAQTRTVN